MNPHGPAPPLLARMPPLVTEIPPSELSRLIQSGDKLRILDVRSRLEFFLGHIPGSQNRPLSTLRAHLDDLDPDETLVVVCLSGARSSHACTMLAQNHRTVCNLRGGTSAWKSAGHKLVTGPKAPRSLDRQSHFVAGLLLAAAFILSALVSPGWIYLAVLPAFGLLLDALTGYCPMTQILRRMPWNSGQPFMP